MTEEQRKTQINKREDEIHDNLRLVFNEAKKSISNPDLAAFLGAFLIKKIAALEIEFEEFKNNYLI